MNIPKEWTEPQVSGGAGDRKNVGAGAPMLKRKGGVSKDDWTAPKRSKRADELLLEDTFDAKKHTNSIILGAKSGGKDETTGRLQINYGKGLDLIPLTENEGGIGSLGLDEMTGEIV